MYLGMNTPGHLDVKHTLVETTVRTTKIPILKEEEVREQAEREKAQRSRMSGLGPALYHADDAYRAQLPQRSALISDSERKTYIEHVQRRAKRQNNNFKFYDVQRAAKVATKGLAKGWK